MRTLMKRHPAKSAIALSILSATLPSIAAEFKPADGIDAKVSSTVTFGTTIRTDAPNPADYALVPSSKVPGAPTGRLVGQNGGADLNFKARHPVSTVLKAVIDADVHASNVGLFVRSAAWTDFTLGHASAPYGNYPNGYTPGAPLSDKGFARDARFDAAEVRDAYLYGHASLGDQSRLDARLGRQVLAWGTSAFLPGGISSATNPTDYAAQVRPGALPQESRVPIDMLDLKFSLDKQFNVEGFVPFESRPSVFPGCGTFFDAASIIPQGCNLAGAIAAPIAGTPLSTINSLSEQSLLGNGYYVHRQADVEAGKGGQFGFALHYTASPLGTEFGLYATRTSNALPAYRITIEDVDGATLPPGLAGGLGRLSNPHGLRYAVEYAGGVRMFGASFDTHLDTASRVFGEIAYRANQPLPDNANDLLNAFLLRAPNSMLQLNHDVLAIPAGGTYDAFDRFGVFNTTLGASKTVAGALGAQQVNVTAEIGRSLIPHLPDPNVMRYGRSLAYGTAPYLANGAMTACSEAAPGLSGVPGKTCTTDGFISKSAWGLRLRGAATYANAFFGASITPSGVVAMDMGGYSYDGTYSAGRVTLRGGLRADWGKRFFVDVQYTEFSGGKYNLMSDRSNVMIAGGAAF
jgi:hypothetical protein